MKKILLAVTFLVFVAGAAALRSFLAPAVIPLDDSARRVVLVAVEGLEPHDANTAFASVPFSGYGLMPTRNGTANEQDVQAGMHMILTGSRSTAPDATFLPDVTRRQRRSLTIHVITGAYATRDAKTLVRQLTGTDGLPEGVSLLVFGVTPSSNALARRERVAPIYYWNRSRIKNPPCLLTSPSTRHRPGLIAATDIATTVTTMLNLPPDQRPVGDGRPIALIARRSTGSPSLTSLLEQNVTKWGRQASEQHLLPFLPWFLAALFGMSCVTPTLWMRRVLIVITVATPLCIIVVVPLVPSVISAQGTVYLLAAIPILGFAITAGRSEVGATRLPRLLAAATMLVLVVDTSAGGYLLTRTPLSYSVLEAARFYGIGNEVSGLFLGAAIVAVGANQGVVATLIWGLSIAVVSGAPGLGADAGGFVAALVAFSVLALRGTSWRKKIKQTIWGSAAIFIVVIGFALWDGTRPEASRTHVGEAVASARKHGWKPIYEIAVRKLSVNARLMLTSPWAVLLYMEVLSLIVRARGQKRIGPSESPSNNTAELDALTAALITLFVLNDSGVVAGSTTGLWLLALPSHHNGEESRAHLSDD